jgi:hypothetical protein
MKIRKVNRLLPHVQFFELEHTRSVNDSVFIGNQQFAIGY